MNRVCSFVLVYIFSTTTHAECWLQVDHYGYMIECPDAVEFKDSEYVIFNDCYGFDPKKPVIEYGEYKIDGNYISFTQRDQDQESFLGTNVKDKRFFIQKNDGSITLTAGEMAFYFKVLRASE